MCCVVGASELKPEKLYAKRLNRQRMNETRVHDWHARWLLQTENNRSLVMTNQMGRIKQGMCLSLELRIIFLKNTLSILCIK